MACWQDTIVLTLRTIIDDMGDSPRYSDESLQSIILVSALMLTRSMTFSNTYSVNIGTRTITPDPGSDNDFIVLCAMKAACQISMADTRKKSERSMIVKDGPSNIDTRPSAEATSKWSDRVCSDFNKAEIQFRIGNGTLGRAIIGPYRVYSAMSQPNNFS